MTGVFAWISLFVSDLSCTRDNTDGLLVNRNADAMV